MNFVRLAFFKCLWFLWTCSCSAENLVNHKFCGRTRMLHNLGNRIIGNEGKAKFGEFPWMALTIQLRNRTDRSSCGGSLINERFILTAAHCHTYSKDYPGSVEVYLGINNRRYYRNIDPDTGRDANSQIHMNGVQKIYMHKSFSASLAWKHDIALIRLLQNVGFSEYVSPICLPLLKSYVDMKTDDSAIVAGWGCTSYNTTEPSNYLRKTTVKRCKLEECRLPADSNDYKLCAGEYNVTSPCFGDSGGPMMKVYQRGDYIRYYQLGVINGLVQLSKLREPVKRYTPGHYSRTFYYRRWILRTITRSNFEQYFPQFCVA